MDKSRKLSAAAFASLVLSAVSGCSMLGIGSTTTFETVKVDNEEIKFAQFNAIENGHPVRCKQFVKSLTPAADGSGFQAVIGKVCSRI